MDLEIIEHREVTIADATELEPVYNQPIVTMGTGDDFQVMTLASYVAAVRTELPPTEDEPALEL